MERAQLSRFIFLRTKIYLYVILVINECFLEGEKKNFKESCCRLYLQPEKQPLEVWRGSSAG